MKLSALSNLFKDPHLPAITDQHTIDKKYRYWRIRTFYAMYVGYAAFYLTRKSFTFAIPQMIQDLHFTKEQIGILGSIFYVIYGMSKFAGGMLSDRSNPRYFMSISLLITAIANIFFGFSSSLMCFILFWSINAIFQGWGWPPCARLLTHWYSQSERGRWWGFWNSSHNIGGAAIPIIVANSILIFGSWRAGLFIPAIITIIIAIFVMNRLRDIPESQGLPPIEIYKKDHVEKQLNSQIKDQDKKSILYIFFHYIFNNHYVWLLAFSYVLVYVVRTAINDWGLLYLDEQGYNKNVAGIIIALFEIGGLVGSLAAGWCSDTIFKGLRGQTNVIFSLGALILVYLFWKVTGNHCFLHGAAIFGIGFFIFGPQMLVATAAAELSHREAAGTSTGFVGLFAYLGAALSAYPLSVVMSHYGWSGFFITIIICAVGAILTLMPLWRAAGHKKS